MTLLHSSISDPPKKLIILHKSHLYEKNNKECKS